MLCQDGAERLWIPYRGASGQALGALSLSGEMNWEWRPVLKTIWKEVEWGDPGPRLQEISAVAFCPQLREDQTFQAVPWT